ncbi:MAG: 50S ribosomal protein L15 [Bacteroidales bacterium]|jgi:large subunit ribosomal protein L15|nr:50S ribosomal protein L15 [Bacteroidales bacterium]
MDLSNLKPAAGSTKEKKRLGRGQGSGRGGTSTRGHKGAQARSGAKRKIGFQGGQMPLQRLVPKFGFTNMNRVEYCPVNLSTLQKLADKGISVITPEVLVENGVTHKKELVKVLAKGELTAKLEVRVHAFSAKAKEMIEAVGGTCDKYETK